MDLLLLSLISQGLKWDVWELYHCIVIGLLNLKLVCADTIPLRHSPSNYWPSIWLPRRHSASCALFTFELSGNINAGVGGEKEVIPQSIIFNWSQNINMTLHVRIAYFAIHLSMRLIVLVSVHALLTLVVESTIMAMVAWVCLERELIPQSTTAFFWQFLWLLCANRYLKGGYHEFFLFFHRSRWT